MIRYVPHETNYFVLLIFISAGDSHRINDEYQIFSCFNSEE